MNFHQKAKEKFDKGVKEHPEQGWDKMSQSVIINEAKDELLDLYNYMNHPSVKDKEFAQSIRIMCVKFYEKLWLFSESKK